MGLFKRSRQPEITTEQTPKTPEAIVRSYEHLQEIEEAQRAFIITALEQGVPEQHLSTLAAESFQNGNLARVVNVFRSKDGSAEFSEVHGSPEASDITVQLTRENQLVKHMSIIVQNPGQKNTRYSLSARRTRLNFDDYEPVDLRTLLGIERDDQQQ